MNTTDTELEPQQLQLKQAIAAAHDRSAQLHAEMYRIQAQIARERATAEAEIHRLAAELGRGYLPGLLASLAEYGIEASQIIWYDTDEQLCAKLGKAQIAEGYHERFVSMLEFVLKGQEHLTFRINPITLTMIARTTRSPLEELSSEQLRRLDLSELENPGATAELHKLAHHRWPITETTDIAATCESARETLRRIDELLSPHRS